MKILLAGMAAALCLAACPDPVMDDIAPGDVVAGPSDTAFWFGEIYGLIDDNGNPARRSYVCDAINIKWSVNLHPQAGAENEAADTAFLLDMIDAAHKEAGSETSFGKSAYATGRIIDINTVLRTLDALCPPGGRFVAIALGSGEAAWSADGTKWTTTVLPGARNWECLAYGNGTFVALAQRNAKVAWSVNGGSSWREADLPLDRTWRSVAYGDGKFIAVAGDTSNASWSANGVNWTDITLPRSAGWRGLAYGQFLPKGFVVVDGSYAHALWSENGLDWNEADLPSRESWYSVAYGTGIYIAMTSDSVKTARSTDGGKTWLPAGDLPSGMRGCSAAYGNDRFVAVSGSNSNKAAWSADGLSWTQVQLPQRGLWSGIAYGNGVFVAMALSDRSVMHSTDGTSWTVDVNALPDLPRTARWQSIVFGK
jgi:hypothetical protein